MTKHRPTPADRQREAEQIAEFIKTKGVTALPPSAALVLGEATPGWRYNQGPTSQRRANATSWHEQHTTTRSQERLSARIGVPFVKSTKTRAIKKNPGTHFVMCQFFDKTCIIHSEPTRGDAERTALHLSKVYGGIGARFFAVFGAVPTEVSWLVTVKPLLERQLHRKATTAAPAENAATADPAATAQALVINPHQE